MSKIGAGVPSFELTELALRLADLTPNNADALRELRPTLHRIVVAPDVSGAVKTLVVQALLLLDDPRLDGTVAPTGNAHGSPLLTKVRKLLESALAAHASAAPTPVTGIAAVRAEFSPNALLSPDTDASLVDEFTVEAREQLAIAESALLVLDSEPDDLQAVDTMFRALHTIKGTSAFLGVEHVTELAHHAESLLARVRNGAARCDGPLSNLLFRAIDMLDAMLVAIETVNVGDVAMLPDGFRELLVALRTDEGVPGESQSAPRVSGSMHRLRISEQSVRVRSADLDRLTDIVRELMLTHSMLARDNALRNGANADLARKLAHAESIVEELSTVTNELRTVAFAHTLQRVVRMARDVATQSGKSIEVITDGETLMIERPTADAIGEALLHMVRNAVDHGIESAAAREAAGKPARGRIRVTAQRLGNNLVVELSDDGIGLDARNLVRHAVERGILSDGIDLSEQEAFSLILRPGFTTAQIVTDISGRGVGMDVVRSKVESLGGTIDIASRAGVGTAFTIRLPFRSHAARSMETWGEPARTIGLIA